MKKFLWILGAVVIIGGGLVAVLLFGPKPGAPAASNTEITNVSEPEPVTEPTPQPERDEPASPEPTPEPVTTDPQLASGRYSEYSTGAVAATGYAETILFFHADWCPECRAFEQAIKAEAIPDGVQILEVDYDSNQDLRQQYEVTLQTTFVKVNQAGERQSLWVGYGRDKSLGIILENT